MFKKILSIKAIGALTLKPFAFTYRAWELERIASFDFFDSFANDVYIEFFGLNIYRIIPKINSKIKNEWCTDRIRFFFDSLTIQKLVNNFIKKNNIYKNISWYGVFLYFKSINIFKFKFNNLINLNLFTINYFLTLNFNLYSLIFLKKFFYSFYKYNIITSTLFSNKYLNIDILNNFFFFNYLQFESLFEIYKYIYLIGYNMRCEHPLFFFKLYTYVKCKQIQLLIFGSFFFYSSVVKTLGLSCYDFLKNFYNFKNVKNNSLFFIGSAFLSRVDFYYINIYFTKLKIFSQMYNMNIMIKYVYYTLIDLNLIYIGLYNDFRLCSSLNKEYKNVYIKYTPAVYNNLIEFNFNFFFFDNEYNIFILQKNLFLCCLLTSNLLINFNYQYHLLIPQLFLYEEEGLVVDIFLNYKYLYFIYAPKTRNVKSSINLIYNIYNLYKLNFNVYLYKYSFFFKRKYYYIQMLKKKYNYNNYYNLNLYLTTCLCNFDNLYIYMKYITVFRLCNSFLLHNLNNFFLVNSYSKLSQILNLGVLLYKNYIYLIK